MNPFFLPCSPISKALGVVFSIAKDFAGWRASGGPKSRKLHDDGTPEHQNLNLSREPSRFLYVYSPRSHSSPKT